MKVWRHSSSPVTALLALPAVGSLVGRRDGGLTLHPQGGRRWAAADVEGKFQLGI